MIAFSELAEADRVLDGILAHELYLGRARLKSECFSRLAYKGVTRHTELCAGKEDCSAGSFFLGASYFGSNMRISTSNPAGYDIKRISTIHAGVNVGYGYNLVAPHNWLFHFSFQPTMVLFSYNRIFYYDDTKDKSNDWSDILVTGRIAVVHYFNKRYFGGLTFNYNDSRTGDSDKILISNGKWKGRVILGMRL